MGFVMSRWPVTYHQLSRFLDFPFKNFVPHTARPSFFYAHALALIQKYKLTSEQIDKSSLHQLHRLLTPIPPPTLRQPPNVAFDTQHRLNKHTSNIQLPIHIWNPTTVDQKYTPYLDPRSTCSFCRKLPEKSPHLFFSCSKIAPVWNFIKSVIMHLDHTTAIDWNYFTTVSFTIPPQDLFSIARYKIWKHRNDIEHSKTDFSAKKIIQAIIRSTHHRL